MSNYNKAETTGCTMLVFYVFYAVTWITNLIKLIACDFEAPYKEEIIHLIGTLIPGTSIITCWF